MKDNQTKDILEDTVILDSTEMSSVTCPSDVAQSEPAFTHKDASYDDLVQKVFHFNSPVLDKSKSNALAKNSSPLCSIARNRPVRSCSMKSQKIISEYFRK